MSNIHKRKTLVPTQEGVGCNFQYVEVESKLNILLSLLERTCSNKQWLYEEFLTVQAQSLLD